MEMTVDPVTGRKNFVQKIINLIPKNFRLILNPRRRCIERFVLNASREIKENSSVLDAGAGPCPYKAWFEKCKYEATDFIKGPNIDFICSLDKIPRNNGTYDAIICTEVLEHVEDPLMVSKELNRVLKKKGTLFLTVPQAYKVHQAPYNFYYYTSYGLDSLLRKAGFRDISITPMGGFFWALSDMLRFNGLAYQKNNLFSRIFLRPLDIIIFSVIFPILLFPLDFLDKKRDWTMGYTVIAKKL